MRHWTLSDDSAPETCRISRARSLHFALACLVCHYCSARFALADIDFIGASRRADVDLSASATADSTGQTFENQRYDLDAPADFFAFSGGSSVAASHSGDAGSADGRAQGS